MASNLPFYDIFIPQKVPLSKISDDVIACDWWFAPPQLKILAKPMFETLQTLVLLTTQLVSFQSLGYQNLNNNCTLFRIETL